MSLEATGRCLVRGSINIDEFFALPHIVRPGETISSTSYTKRAGGKGANQAYSVARAGGIVDLDGSIGDDGTWVRDMLEGVGVGVGRLRVVEGVTGRAIIQSSKDGENSIVLHAGANYHKPPEDTDPDLLSYTHILLQNEIPYDSTLRYLDKAGKQGITSIYNPSPMPSPQQLRAFPWDNLSWLIVNEGELEDLLLAFGSGVPKDKIAGGDVREKAERGIRDLHGCEGFDKSVSIICTLGAQGILYFQPWENGGGIGYLPAASLKRELRDTTGAGDCFAGYFVAGLMAKREGGIEEILKSCLTACAICVESPGAMESVPSREDVGKRLE